MNKLGVSLPWDYLSDSCISKEAVEIKKSFGSSRDFLTLLKTEGVSSIELRHRKKDLSPEEIHKAVETVINAGFSITLHGDALPLPESFEYNSLFPWDNILRKLCRGYKDLITVTFHPIIAENNKILSAKLTTETLWILSQYRDDSIYNFVLENQRSKGYIDPGITFTGVVNMVKKIPGKKIGICWDMGHSYSNTVNYNHPPFPPKEFLERVTHTHIHDLGPTGRTHWPFKENNVPLKENIELLKSFGYKGVDNLELSFDRFSEEPDIKGMVMSSIRALRSLVNIY